MRYYEKDDFVVPEKYEKMSLEQLERRCKVWEKVSVLFSKIMPSSKKNIENNSNVKFNF